MRRLLGSLLAIAALGAALGTAPARADAGFGLKNLDVTFSNEDGSSAVLAGTHPFAVTFDIDANSEELPGGEVVPIEAVKDIKIEQPSGFAGDPTAVPRCSAAVFIKSAGGAPPCPNETVVGKTTVEIAAPEEFFTQPVYNMVPPPGALLKLGFIANGIPVTLEVTLSPVYPYNPLVTVSNIAEVTNFYSSSTTVWGNPAGAEHDTERGTCLGSKGQSLGSCPVSALDERPFITLPRSCTGPLLSLFEADSWQNPGAWFKSAPIATHDDSEPPQPRGLSNCASLRFEPRIEAQPTSDQADSPTGLDFELDVEDEGIADPLGTAQSDLKKAVVTLPAGVTANPSLAEGLIACPQAGFAAEKLDSQPGEGCPQAAKVGTVEVQSPLLEGKLLKGQLFVAEPYANPYGTLLALYMVIRDPELGILVKLPGKIEPDPQSGRLITTFGEAPYEIPQFPISHLRLHLREGGRSPLVTPPGCGTYATQAQLTPWANPDSPVSLTASFTIDRGPAGSACPAAAPFAPGFAAGSINNSAGSHSPFYIQLTRRDGEQDLTRFSVKLPPGVTATLAGVDQCPDAAIAAARAKSGRAEQAAPSCPANSRIGSVIGGAGVGSQLTYVSGDLYLAGPWEGAPISAVAIVPALAGPFDVGTVVVRQALRIDPLSAQVEVDGAHSEPIPHILAGIPLRVRDVRAYIDRPDFTLNPTSCDPFSVGASIWGGGGDPLSTADDVAVAAGDYYQAAGCAALDFKPKLALNLKGGTKRGDYQSLRAVVKTNEGPDAKRPEANIASAAVTLPHSAFLANEHIRTVCTRVQYAAGAGNGAECPKGSIYGRARAVTPLLDDPLEGPVYLRSSSHPLPDVVVALHGLIDIELSGQTDSVNEGIRNTFASVPDAPATKFVLELFGGKKALIVNSRNLCQGPKQKATAHFTGQNGAVHDFRPVVRNSCKKAKKSKKHRSR